MDKKGFTLTELIISISLISIVILFLFNLLVDVRHSMNQTDYSIENQQNRALIIKMVQDDFINYGLIGLSDSNSRNTSLVLDFTYGDSKTGRLTITSKEVTYKRAEGDTEKWDLEDDNATYNVNCVSYSVTSPSLEGDYFAVKFTIPVIVNNKKNNYIDDLEFSYIGEKNNVNLNNFVQKTSLGKYSNNCS